MGIVVQLLILMPLSAAVELETETAIVVTIIGKEVEVIIEMQLRRNNQVKLNYNN